jgi:hypothetical protein
MKTRLLIASAFFLSASVHADQCFQFAEKKMGPEQNFAAVTTNDAIAAAARAQLLVPIEQRKMIIGKIARGNGDRNGKWSWHFIPGDWSFAEMAIEVCDATPSYIEENLDAWLKSPVTFCPWASYVTGECPKLPTGIAMRASGMQSQALVFKLERAADISLEARRMDGSLAATLLSGRVEAGDHEAALDTRGLARGVYRIVLKADGRIASTANVALP